MTVFVWDPRGREWSVHRPLAPWRRRAPSLKPVAKAKDQPPKPLPFVVEFALEVAGVFLWIVLIAKVVYFIVALVLGSLALGVVSGVLYVLRALGLARHRIDMCRLAGGEVRSLTVLLVRGSHRHADAIVQDIATALATDGRVPAGVTTR